MLKMILFISAIAFYIIAVNFLSYMLNLISSSGIIQEMETSSGTIEQMGMGDNVQVSVQRKPKLYGRGYSNGEDDFFMVLNLFKMPTKLKGVSLKKFHWIFFTLLFFLFALSKKTERRRK